MRRNKPKKKFRSLNGPQKCCKKPYEIEFYLFLAAADVSPVRLDGAQFMSTIKANCKTFKLIAVFFDISICGANGWRRMASHRNRRTRECTDERRDFDFRRFLLNNEQIRKFRTHFDVFTLMLRRSGERPRLVRTHPSEKESVNLLNSKMNCNFQFFHQCTGTLSLSLSLLSLRSPFREYHWFRLN